ncbi:MAG: DUF2493 domain-containing protein, partial [Holophagaceae bacterium]|nr:DUF2493 domain-containing protein [Holophagaceae bacterium]
MCRTIIAGSRCFSEEHLIAEAVKESGFQLSSVISGCARGVDTLAINWASKNGIRVEKFPANWNLYGKSAGYKRNKQMADVADALIAIWDGDSRGTKHMIDIATAKGVPVFVKIIRSHKETIL